MTNHNSSLQFWKNFQKPTSSLYLFALTILTISLIIFGLAHFRGLENVIHWDVLSELNDLPIVLDQFKISAKETLTIPAKAITVTEQFVASPMAINTLGNYVFLGLFTVGFLLIISALSALRRFWYLVFMGSVILLIVTFNFGLVFNFANNYINLIFIVLYAGTSYFFHAFRPDIDILKRFGIFFCITVLLGFSIAKFSTVEHPFLLLASYRTSGAMLLSIGFTFWVSYEIINGFLIISTSSKSSNSLFNLLIISLIYLSNVLLVLLYNNKVIDWNMIYLSPFLLLITSIILGIWGFRQREHLSREIMDFEESGAFIYVGLGIITLATCGLAFATANDPMIEVMEDAVTYSHLAMGVTFLAYIILNFSYLFRQGLEVYKVVFKPNRFSLWFFRILALIIIGSLLLPKDFFPVTQFSTASYNALGDYYTTEKDYKFAEIQYKLALNYEPRNHKSNYALASLALLQGDNETAGVYFRKALAKNPSEFAYEALGRSIYDNDKFFETIFVLKEGLQKFPKSGELQNNLAYLYNKSKLLDSTVVYYELATKNAHKSEVPASNLMAFWATNAKDKSTEDILNNAKNLKYNSYQANLLALKLKAPQPPEGELKSDLETPPLGVEGLDSTLNTSDFAWVYNHALSQKSAGNSLPIRRLSELEDNESLSEDLLFANVIQDYYKGDKLLAFQNLQLWAMGDSTDKKGKYYGMLLNTFLKKETLRTSDNVANFSTIAEAEKALKQNPLNEAVVEKAVQLYNQNKASQKAYETLLRAISWRKDSPKLYELYITQAQTIGMKDYAADGLEVLRKLSPTDYQRFLPTYQAKQQSIEKAGAGFQ
jgi:Flp pilus assembly protein TadD